MARLLQPFNARQHNPVQSAGQLPVGRHKVCVIANEVKATKANDGGYLQLTLKITDGPNAGVTGPCRYNLYSNSAQSVQIAHDHLAAVAYVTGVFDFVDADQLHGVEFFVDVTPQKNSPEYTEVSKVYDINGNEPGKPPVNQPSNSGFAQPQNAQQPAQWGQQAQPEAPQQAWGNTGNQPQQQPQGNQGWNGQPAHDNLPNNPSPAQAAAQPAWGQGQPAQQQGNPGFSQVAAQPAQTGWGQQAAPQGNQPAWGQK